MKIYQIIESTTSGSVATVSSPLGTTQYRNPSIYSGKTGNLLKGKKKKGPYANSISEGKKDFASKLAGKIAKTNKDKKETEEKIKQHQQSQKKDKVDEAKLDEEDVIIVPGKGMRRHNGFIPHGESRIDHEVEMARSDLIAAYKNAKVIYGLIKNRSEEDGLEGWVQEKIIKANDYLNTVAEYLESKEIEEGLTGAALGGVAGAAITKTPSGAMMGAELGSEIQDKFTNENGGVIAGGVAFESKHKRAKK